MRQNDYTQDITRYLTHLIYYYWCPVNKNETRRSVKYPLTRDLPASAHT